MLSIDLNRFKDVNDTLGHRAGDALLKQVSLRLRTLVRKQDVLVRMGGDEFVLLLDDCQGATAAEEVAARALECLERAFDLQPHFSRDRCKHWNLRTVC